MAFKPRNKDNGIEKVANVDDFNNLDELNNLNTENNQNQFIPEITNFHEKSIQILNILDSRGINIYDETRTPGMYLKNSKNVTDNKKLRNILGENILSDFSKKENHQQEQRTPQSIIEFLCSQK